MISDWIDISTPIAAGMQHWPGDPDVTVTRFAEIGRGHDYNATSFSMSAHTGTHVDAPLHFIAGARSIDEMPVTQLIGAVRVVLAAGAEKLQLERGERVLIKNGAADGISSSLAAHLAAACPPCLGIDALTMGSADVHQALLGAGVWIIEGLRLEHIEPGRYEMVCLPLRIVGADGAPARALLRRVG
jgi:arylformamidase